MSGRQGAGHDGVWVKAARSSDGQNCVEMRRQSGTVQVRDSKNPHGEILAVAPAQFAAWVRAAASGQFSTSLD